MVMPFLKSIISQAQTLRMRGLHKAGMRFLHPGPDHKCTKKEAPLNEWSLSDLEVKDPENQKVVAEDEGGGYVICQQAPA